jgi:hypothetical protein
MQYALLFSDLQLILALMTDPAAQPLKTFWVMPLPPLIERMDAGYVSREAQGRTQSASLGRAMT